MKCSMKRWMAALLATALLGTNAALGEGLKVIATCFPCYDLARQTLGDLGEVTMLIKPGMEVHTYEPSPTDILSIGDADLFLCIGGESEAWVDEVLVSMGDGAPEVLRLIDSVQALKELEDDEAEGDAHVHGDTDPEGAPDWDEHIWTSPKNAIRMLSATEEALCALAPEQAEAIHANAGAYGEQLSALDARLADIVAGGVRRKLVFADRFPFQYLAHDYGLEVDAAFLSCTSQTEPSARKLMELIDTVIRENIPVVYTIEMSNGAIAQAVCQETGAEALELHSMQTVRLEEFEAGETMVSLMEKNLEAIRRGLN